MNYIFEINVNTDGDFSIPFIPCGMEYDGYDRYRFRKVYNDRNRAVKDVLDVCAFLKEQMHTSREYVKRDWNKCIDNFVECLKSSKETVYERIEEYIGGNYDGTEFVFYAQAQKLKCEFSVTDEEYEMIKSNNNNVTHDMIKDVVLALFKN